MSADRDVPLLFSYGSNMCRERLLARTPSAQIVGRAVLRGHDLRFHKLSDVDGSGKADAFRTGRAADRVWGVLARLSTSDKERMDEIEGVGTGYEARRALVRRPDGSAVLAHLYAARDVAVRPGLRPFLWYRRLVIEGAVQHGLPSPYVERLRSSPADSDPDVERARHNLSVLA